MRTLFISNVVPWPLNGGAKIRANQILRALTEVSDVTLVCFTHPGEEEQAQASAIQNMVREVHTVSREMCRYRELARKSRSTQRIHGLFDLMHPRRPAFLSHWHSAYATQLVKRLQDQHFDLIWGEHLGSWNLLTEFSNVRRILDLDDVEHRKQRHRMQLLKTRLTLPFEYFDFLKLRRFELGLPERECEVLVCSEKDRNIFAAGKRVWVIPNGTELPLSVTSPESRQQMTLLFPGSLDYSPNVDAVHYFCEKILPAIKELLPGVRLQIVGSRPTRSISRLHNGETVFVHADVPDMGIYYSRATAVVVPIRFGGGTRIKILEAMAHHTPVISSTVGAEGIEAKSGEHLLLADDPVDFAEACVNVCQRPSLRERLSDAGYSLVRDFYQWPHIRKQVQAVALHGHDVAMPILLPQESCR